MSRLGRTVLSVEALPAGTRVCDWKVLRRLAAGGYGTVYAVHRAGSLRPREFALKLAHQPGSRWFSREAELLTRLRHPGVPRLLAAETWPLGDVSHPFLVMEHVEGESLYAWSQARNPSARDVGALLLQAAEVLAFAHQRGVLHRDFKGDNVRVRPGGRLALLDWGAGWHAEATPLTGTGQLPPGTALYASPQLHLLRAAVAAAQAVARPAYSVADELYAVGVTFYRLLAEAYPAPAFDAAERFVEGHASTLGSLNPRVPKALASLVARLLAFSPEARPANALELVSELRRLLKGAGADWDVPLFAWTVAPSTRSRSTQPDAGAVGPVAPGQEVTLLHARLQRRDQLQRLRDARELRHRVPAHVAFMEARARLAANPVRPGWRSWLQVAGGVLLALALAAVLAWGLGWLPKSEELPAPPSVAHPADTGQAAASGAALPSPAPHPLEKQAMTVLPKQERTPSARTLAKRCTLAVGALSTLSACAGVPRQPKPQSCPPEALRAMKELGLHRDAKAAITLDIRYPWRMDAEDITVGDGDIISVQQDKHGRLPAGTLLYGHLWTGGEMVVGRYTKAETPDGRTYPICFVLGNGEGWWKDPGSKPGAATLSRNVGYAVMDAFP